MEQNPGKLQENSNPTLMKSIFELPYEMFHTQDLNFSMRHILLSQQYKQHGDWIIHQLKKFALTCISLQICLKIDASILADTVAVGSCIVYPFDVFTAKPIFCFFWYISYPLHLISVLKLFIALFQLLFFNLRLKVLKVFFLSLSIVFSKNNCYFCICIRCP